jgi:hypothetical protein
MSVEVEASFVSEVLDPSGDGAGTECARVETYCDTTGASCVAPAVEVCEWALACPNVRRNSLPIPGFGRDIAIRLTRKAPNRFQVRS